MSKVILYFKNVVIGLSRIPKSWFNLYKYSKDDDYVKNLFVVLDCFGNAVSGGDPNETISSRSAKAMAAEQQSGSWGIGCRLCSFLAVFQQNHCAKALDRNVGSQAVVADK